MLMRSSRHWRSSLRLLAIAGAMLGMPAAGEADVIGTLEQVAPSHTTYVFDIAGDFYLMGQSPTGSATGSLQALDVNLDPSDPPSSNTSGCEASDFAGFVAGSIALIQRGTCTFEVKALNAEAAGAIGVLIFNEGQVNRTGPQFGTLLDPTVVTIPVLGLSYALGESLYYQTLSGPVTISMSVTNTPEPATVSLLALGLGAMAARRRKSGPRSMG